MAYYVLIREWIYNENNADGIKWDFGQWRIYREVETIEEARTISEALTEEPDETKEHCIEATYCTPERYADFLEWLCNERNYVELG